MQKILVSKDKTFKVEKVLDKKNKGRKTLLLVQWLGWPAKFASWIDQKELADVQKP